MKKLGGVLIPHLKSTGGYMPEAIPTPPKVTIPVLLHFGSPLTPVVSVGDEVKVGQIIAGAERGGLSSPIYASVSGTVKRIADYDELTGVKYGSKNITIAADGMQTPLEGLGPVSVSTPKEFCKAVRDSGVVGLGGTEPFARHEVPRNINYILINCIECEPHITSDTASITIDPKNLFDGVLLFKEHLISKKIVICVPSSTPHLIRRMQELALGVTGVEVEVLTPDYPQGLDKILVRSVTGQTVPEGGSLSDIGCMVLDCTAVAAIAKYIKTGQPITTRCITVDGSSVKFPKNVIAPIGTSVYDLLNYCGVYNFIDIDDVGKVILGGPMRGVAVPNLNVSVTKTTNAVIAMKKKDCEVPEPTPCIKCNRCNEVCPMNLMPPYFENAFKLRKVELLEKYKVSACVECGCCAFVCPAKRPLAQAIALSKNMLCERTAQDREARMWVN